MKAIDTNVLVRFLVNDDKKQGQRARRIIAAGHIFIPKTVLLETEWVLRYTYGFDREAVAVSLKKVCGLPQVTIEDAPSVTPALTWHGDGFDFADALHLASARAAQSFYSFDRALAHKAKEAGTIPVVQP